METRTKGKGTIDRGLRESVGTLDDANPTRLSKRSQAVPLHYLVKRQDAAVARTTFYRVAGLKSLANNRLRSYHTHKVWCGGVDEGLIECGKAQE